MDSLVFSVAKDLSCRQCICMCIKLKYRLMVGTFSAVTNAFVVWEQIVLPHPNTRYGIMHTFQLAVRSIDTKKIINSVRVFQFSLLSSVN